MPPSRNDGVTERTRAIVVCNVIAIAPVDRGRRAQGRAGRHCMERQVVVTEAQDSSAFGRPVSWRPGPRWRSAARASSVMSSRRAWAVMKGATPPPAAPSPPAKSARGSSCIAASGKHRLPSSRSRIRVRDHLTLHGAHDPDEAAFCDRQPTGGGRVTAPCANLMGASAAFPRLPQGEEALHFPSWQGGAFRALHAGKVSL